jgi:hypothetical protein
MNIYPPRRRVKRPPRIFRDRVVYCPEEVPMPTDKRPGKKGVYFEFPDEFLREFRAFVDAFPLGTATEHVLLALRRHMATPPTVAAPGLPPVGADGLSPKKKPPGGRGRRA